MTENHNKEEIESEEEEMEQKEKDLEAYYSEMKSLETDFSDLDDMDLEELKEIQEAISKVKEMKSKPVEKVSDLNISDELKEVELQTEGIQLDEYLAQREAMISDFSDLEEIEFEELQDMQGAIESVKKEQFESSSEEFAQTQSTQAISSELEEKIKQELLERKVKKEKEIITPEKLLANIKDKRDKIWYHTLYYLVYQAEDHIASKELLYDMLKENTSKSPIDPIPEQQFYFGLGYILRLTLNEKQIVRFLRGGKFKINIGVKILKELLEQSGEPIITKPVLKEEEKKRMFTDFIKEDFTDI
ncbi:MAG: hypothetical protein ACXACC_02190 [Promethearchaeota archaeon]|jgi:hypothetical protein